MPGTGGRTDPALLNQASCSYELRVASHLMLTLATGTKLTCKDAVSKLLKPNAAGGSAPPAKVARAAAGRPGRVDRRQHPSDADLRGQPWFRFN